MGRKGPWKRKGGLIWYVNIDGERINLGRDRQRAFTRYAELLEDGPTRDCKVRELLDRYWLWLKANRAETTSESREPVLKSFGLSIPPKLTVRSLRPHHVQAWVDEHTWGPTTQHTRIQWIKTAIAWGVKQGYASKNPLAGMERPRPRIRQDYLPESRWQELLNHCKPDLREMLAFMLLTGARVEEVLRLESDHLQGSRIVLDIEDSKGRHTSRVINLPPAALDIVKGKNAGLIFVTRAGKPWDKNSLRCRFRSLKRLMKMPGLCGTTLRHSFARHQLEQGVDSTLVAALLSHSSTRMLYERYGHLGSGTLLADTVSRTAPLLDLGGISTDQAPQAQVG